MNQMIVTHHVRDIFMPIDQNIKKLYLQQNHLLNQNNSIPQTVFAKNNQTRTVSIFATKFNPISSGPGVCFGTKLKVLIIFFIEYKQQDDSVHLFTIIKRNKFKSTDQCLSIEYNFLPQGEYLLNNNSINTHIDCYKTVSPLQVHIQWQPNKEP